MASSLLAIAESGALAASAALDVTAQNIANVSTPGYVDRGISQTELIGNSAGNTVDGLSLFGVGPVSVTRNVSAFQQAEVRSTNAAATSADTQVSNLTNVQSALEQTNLYASVTGFATALQALAGNPADSSLRAGVLSAAQAMTQTFNLSSNQLAQAGQTMQADAAAGVGQMNQLATSLAAINVKITADADPAANQASLLDQRDALLQQMSQIGDITTTIAPDATVRVQMGGTSGPQLVSGGSASPLAMTSAADGTIAFTLGGQAFAPSGGSLAGDQQSLATLATTTTGLDTIAATLVADVNTAQTGGVDLNGNAGLPLFSGNSAATVGLALTSGSQIATAPAGAAAGSTDPTNLGAIQTALAAAGTASRTNALLLTVSNAVHNATTQQTALDAIAQNARTALDTSAGVNLDQEAANLLKYQQAYQASGKVIETAQTLFTSLLADLP